MRHWGVGGALAGGIEFRASDASLCMRGILWGFGETRVSGVRRIYGLGIGGELRRFDCRAFGRVQGVGI